MQGKVINGTHLSQIFATLLLTSILSLGASLILLQAADAVPTEFAQSAASEIIGDQQNNNRLSPRLVNAVHQDLFRKQGIPAEKLRVIGFSRKTWSNGCLGLPHPGEFCTEALVPGWRIVLSDGHQTWFYRTDTQGRVLRLENQTASRNGLKNKKTREIGNRDHLNPARIPHSELPPPLSEGVIFRAIASGGITGRTYQTTLLKDGRVLRALLETNTETSVTKVRQIPVQQIQQFQQLLQKNFPCFNQLSYQAPEGAADFITITLTSSAGTVRYTDIIQGRLPKSLQEVIQAWNQIAKSE
jgi:hypothetical protein